MDTNDTPPRMHEHPGSEFLLSDVDAADVPSSLHKRRPSSCAGMMRVIGQEVELFPISAASFAGDEVNRLPGHHNGKAELHRHLRSTKDSFGCVIGVDIGGSNVRVALADRDGTILDRSVFQVIEAISTDALIAAIETCVDDLLERNSLPRSCLLSIAAGAPGVTDVETGVVIATSYLRAWHNVPLRDLLESTFRIPAAVENDVNLAAIGEHWIGAARDISNFVFLAIGTGIGAGIFLNGQLYRGQSWTAGEIGYMLVPGAPEMTSDRGQPGSLESMIGGNGIELHWKRACEEAGDQRPQHLAATDIFARAQTGDQLAKSMLDQSAKLLAYAVLNTSLIVDCSAFVLGGGVGSSQPLYEATRQLLGQWHELIRPNLTQSTLGQDAQLLGAIRLALDTTKSVIEVSQ